MYNNELGDAINGLHPKELDRLALVFKALYEICTTQSTQENAQFTKQCDTKNLENDIINDALMRVADGVPVGTATQQAKQKYGINNIGAFGLLELTKNGGFYDCRYANKVVKALNNDYGGKVPPHIKGNIRRARQQGASLRRVGRAYGVSKSTVQRICNDI